MNQVSTRLPILISIVFLYVQVFKISNIRFGILMGYILWYINPELFANEIIGHLNEGVILLSQLHITI